MFFLRLKQAFMINAGSRNDTSIIIFQVYATSIIIFPKSLKSVHFVYASFVYTYMDASIVHEIQSVCRSVTKELLRSVNLQDNHFCYVDEDDFIQEGFVRAIELYPAYDPSLGSLVGFLTTPVRNHLKNYLDRLFRGKKAFRELWNADRPNPNFDERRTVETQRRT
jgi:hypothetical protein